MRRLCAGSLAGLVLALIVQVQVQAGPRLPCLFYLFAPGQAAVHGGELEAVAQAYQDRLQVVGIVSGEQEIPAQEGVCEFLNATQARQCPYLPEMVSDRLGGTEDYLLLLDAAGQPVAAETGYPLAELQEVLALVAGRKVTTEVDESTWGKIKELFR